jgi:hypothetical protein
MEGEHKVRPYPHIIALSSETESQPANCRLLGVSGVETPTVNYTHEKGNFADESL